MILIPKINPIRLSLLGVNEPKVEYAFYRDYYQKFQRTDSTKIQILIPDEEEVKDWALSAVSTDDETFSYTAPKKTFNNAIARRQAVEYDIDFSKFPEGTFRFILQADNGLQYLSDIICVKNTHEYTRLLSYCNTYNEHGVAFSTGIVFHLRVETQLYKSAIPKSEGSTYTDNMGGYRTLTSSPYTNYRLNIGGGAGIPEWLIKIINRAFSCDTLFLNHAEIVKSDGATLEAVEQDNYNLRSWNIEIGQIENNLFYQEHLLTVNGGQQLPLNINRDAQSIPVIIFATAAWEVVGNYPDWITVTPVDGGANGNTVMLTFAGNIKTTARSGIIFFRLKDRHAITVEVSVVQEGTTISRVTWLSFVNIREFDSDNNVWRDTNEAVATILEAANPNLGVRITYNLLSAFGTFSGITVDQWRKMALNPRTERIEAFKAYINNLEVISIDDIQTNDVYRTALKIRLLGNGGMRIVNDNLRISI